MIFLCTTLSGCFSGESADCIQIGFPAPGAEVKMEGRFIDAEGEPRGRGEGLSWIRFQEWTNVPRGDGNMTAALVAHRVSDGSPYYFEVATGSHFLYDSKNAPSVSLSLNYGTPLLGYLFWGRCLEAGQEWSVPVETPEFEGSVKITQAGREEVVAVVEHPPFPASVGGISGNKSGEPKRYIYTWHESRLFPDEMRIEAPFDGGFFVSTIWRLQEQTVVTVERDTPGILDLWVPTEPVGRWPHFHLEGLVFPYQEFLELAAKRQDVQEYLEAHPNAVASYVRYQEVDEPESRAYLWKTLLRDEGPDGLEIVQVRRCFTSDVYVLMFGECEDRDHYSDGAIKNVSVEEMDAIPAPATVSTQTVVDRLRILRPDADPVFIEWRRYPITHSFPYAALEGQAGWYAGYGTSEADVTYRPTGVEVWGTSTYVQGAVVSASGWVMRLPVAES